MKKLINLILFFCLSLSAVLAQSTFVLQHASAPVVKNSLYNTISFLDTRSDYEYNSVEIKGSEFVDKLNALLISTIDKSAKNGELFFQLRDLNIFKARDYYYSNIRANLFNKQDNNYYLIDSIDVSVKSTSVFDLKIKMTDVIFNLLVKNLTKSYIDSESYTLNDIYNFDLVEKDQINAYNKDLTDGLYINFKDFANQYPLDDKVQVDFKKEGQIKEVKATNVSLSKTIKVQPQDIYAVVYNGQAYISYDNQFIPLYKENEDYLFQYKAPLNINTSILPVIATAYYISQPDYNVIYKVDHLNGDIFPIGKR